MTEPENSSEVPDADRAEQQAMAGEVAAPADGVSEGDALDQQLTAGPDEAGGGLQPVGDREANEADVLEQEIAVPADDADDNPV